MEHNIFQIQDLDPTKIPTNNLQKQLHVRIVLHSLLYQYHRIPNSQNQQMSLMLGNINEKEF